MLCCLYHAMVSFSCSIPSFPANHRQGAPPQMPSTTKQGTAVQQHQQLRVGRPFATRSRVSSAAPSSSVERPCGKPSHDMEKNNVASCPSPRSEAVDHHVRQVPQLTFGSNPTKGKLWMRNKSVQPDLVGQKLPRGI